LALTSRGSRDKLGDVVIIELTQDVVGSVVEIQLAALKENLLRWLSVPKLKVLWRGQDRQVEHIIGVKGHLVPKLLNHPFILGDRLIAELQVFFLFVKIHLIKDLVGLGRGKQYFYPLMPLGFEDVVREQDQVDVVPDVAAFLPQVLENFLVVCHYTHN